MEITVVGYETVTVRGNNREVELHGNLLEYAGRTYMFGGNIFATDGILTAAYIVDKGELPKWAKLIELEGV